MKELFDNTKKAFILKSDAQLWLALILFKIVANKPLVRIGSVVTKLAIKAHLPVESLIRKTIFDHFCGGVSKECCLSVINQMYKKNVSSILDYSVEGKEVENQFDIAMDKIVKVLCFAKEKAAIPFAVFKPTSFGRFQIFQKVTDKKLLTESEQQEWHRIEQRYHTVCKKASELNLSILIDAEESWIQQAADDLALKMMQTYNLKETTVFNTAQMYRWDRLEYLKTLVNRARAEGFKVGIKIVRGAYMEKENERAQKKEYKSPICNAKEVTDNNFDAAVKFMINNIEVCAIFSGTHNERSSYKLLRLMSKNGINPKNPKIWSGQLFGMSDHITYNLADAGYLVAKYLPYGPIRNVIPYLIRRAEENTSFAGQTTRELFLIKKEMARRKLQKNI